jgi:ribose transport system permease protein
LTLLQSKLKSSSSQPIILVGALVVLILISGILTPGFLTYRHLTTILYANTMLGILALAQTIVLISGGLDMSIGSIYWVSITFGAVLMVNSNGNTIIPVLICIALGTFTGFINGIGIAKLKIPHVVMTLAMMIAITGIIYVSTGGGLKGRATDALIEFSTGRVLGFPIITMIWIFFTIIFYYILKMTSFGWKIKALGSNLIASYCSGIQVERLQIIVYSLSGFLASISGLFYLGWARKPYQTFQSGGGVGAELTLETLTAVVIGGTMFSGGRGGVGRTFIGVFILAILNSILVMAGLGFEWKLIMHGLIIVIVVGVYSVMKNR